MAQTYLQGGIQGKTSDIQKDTLDSPACGHRHHFEETTSDIVTNMFYLCAKFTSDSMKKFIVFLLFALFYICSSEAQGISSGLYFSAHTAIKEKRTGMHIAPRFDASQGLSLDFDINLRQELHNYGYIFRIIINEAKSFDLIINFSDKRRSLNLIEGNKICLSFTEKQLATYKHGEWAHVECTVRPDSVAISFNGESLQSNIMPISIDEVQIYFGYSNHSKFHSNDVPPMCIRNVRISDSLAHAIAYWPLKKHTGTQSLDSLHRTPATTINPIWEINQHTKWKKIQGFTLPAHTQICHAPSHHSIYMANAQHVLRYDTKEKHIDTLHVAYGSPFIEKNNQLIYHESYKELWSYDFDDHTPLSRFDFAAKTWSHDDTEIKNPEYSQHNAFLSPYDSCLYIFGGYGNYYYKNAILRKSRPNLHWEEVPYSPAIPPRYLAGTGWKGKDTILVFGGCGNPQGKQELGITNYFDLWAIDIRTFKTSQLWDASRRTAEAFAVGNNIVVNKEKNTFYALCFANDRSNSSLQLKSFSIRDGNATNYADTIPFAFNDVNSFATLYYDPALSQLYAVTSCQEDGQSHIGIYSLNYPPLTIGDTLQEAKRQGASGFAIGSIAAALAAIAAVLFLREKRCRKQSAPPAPEERSRAVPATSKDAGTTDAPAPQKVSSILFLDGFQVWDKEGNDITRLFTPILKQLLILIILYGENNKKGISNATLRETLWADKNEESVQNNRRVNMHKLKQLLEKLDGVELAKENTYWSIVFTRAYCDYIEALRFIGRVKDGQPVAAKDIPIALLSGQLLPYVQAEWVDPFKASYSNAVLDTAVRLSGQCADNNDLAVQLADVMFAHDKTDEFALKLKCRALTRNGRISLAKNTFESFRHEYKMLLDTEYAKSFNDIISETH